MKDRKISRRTFIRDTSLMMTGAIAASLYLNGCTRSMAKRFGNASAIKSYNPKTDGGCAVSFGYDVDMPPGGDIYLYDRNVGWTFTKDVIAHGHLNDDIRDYIEKLGNIAESYDSRLDFFIQGNTFEKQVDVDFWRKFVKRGHPINSHNYNHDSLTALPPDTLRSRLTKTKNLIETELGTKNIGLRTPNGLGNGLRDREDTQQAIVDVGIEWVSTLQNTPQGPNSDQKALDMIPNQQPFYYVSGLLEFPIPGHIDRSFFDVDMGGSPRPVDEWIAYLKHCVDLAYEQNLFIGITLHPSTSFKHDRKARYVDELLAYCHQKKGVVFCTAGDMYRWIENDRSSIAQVKS